MTKANRMRALLEPKKGNVSTPPEVQHIRRNSIQVTLGLKIDLSLLRRQKRALIDIREGAHVSSEQEDAAEGLLNMIDFIQDSILDQGLATEQEIFPRLPSLFEAA